jgi:UDP-N-acetylmuramoyl-L-alanyl-D-glutamate--2,6-diaminopimelate ligase
MVRNAVLNVDEETSVNVLRDLEIPHLTFGIAAAADLFARDIEITEAGVGFELKLQGMHALPISLRMTGMFNVYNAIAAASCAMVLGISHEDIRAGLEKIENVPGRIEMLPTHTPYRVILDYAHAPDALDNILRTCREFTRGRLIALFGCGGDRDKGKRPIMGRIGGELADLCILTSDNPRNEEPMDILASIEEGIKETACEYVVIENRREAIRYALKFAGAGDVVVLAGKGHETYQEIRGEKHPFDEKVVVRQLQEEM